MAVLALLAASAPARIVATDAGERVSYQRLGSGPDLVFVHGWPLHSETFRALVVALSSRYTCHLFRMSDEPSSPASLELREQDGRRKYYLDGRPVSGGDLLEVCFSGGWLTMRYEFGSGDERPHFHFSVELGGGRVWESSLQLPEDALLRWPASRFVGGGTHHV